MNYIVFSILILVIGIFERIQCGYFDYTDFDDPLQLIWNNKNKEKDSKNTCLTNINHMDHHYPVEGICKSQAECRFTGGFSGGSCGLLSTCCVYRGGCGSKLSGRVSYFQSTNITDNPNCIAEVKLQNKNICQLRVDFIEMILAPPAEHEPHKGMCAREKLYVEGHPEIPQFCGKNTGQHLYISVNGHDTTPVKFHIDLIKDAVIKRGWMIKITQLHCPRAIHFHYKTQIKTFVRDFPLLAPHNCLQYFTERKGSFKSFGCDVSAPATCAYNVNQFYAICFKRHHGVCGIRFTVGFFKVGRPNSENRIPRNPKPQNPNAGNPDPVNPNPGNPHLGNPNPENLKPGNSSSGKPNAPNEHGDFLYIPGLQLSNDIRDERMSGEKDSNKNFISITPGPFYVFFKSDSEVDIGQEVGFHIYYELLTVCP